MTETLTLLVTLESMVICDDREAQIGSRYPFGDGALHSGSSEHTAAHKAYVEAMRDHRNQDGGF